ncbi:hypothetical protein BGW39_007231 [Mortierella sp. 14UC]|nr:hypothetical protein BGW39_007231 [Mortierella sp. 14UC]
MKLTTALAALAAITVSSVSAQFTNFVNASRTSTQYAGSNFTSSPYPWCIGKEFCLTATGTLSTDIVKGSRYDITGRTYGRLTYTDSHDLCSLLAASGTPCPIPAGPFNLNLCVPVKPNLPPNFPTEFIFAAINGDGGILFAPATPGYVSNPREPSNPRLYGVICP